MFHSWDLTKWNLAIKKKVYGGLKVARMVVAKTKV